MTKVIHSFYKFETTEKVDKHICELPLDFQQQLLTTISNVTDKYYDGYTFFNPSSYVEGETIYVFGYNNKGDISKVYMTKQDIENAFTNENLYAK